MTAEPRVAGQLRRMAPIAAAGIAVVVANHLQTLLHPRVWAEEGATYYAACVGRSASACLGHIEISGLLLLMNAIVFTAAQLDPIWLPTVTVYASSVMLVALAFQAAHFCTTLPLPAWMSLVFVADLFLLPATYETFLTATNLHWIVGLSLLFVLVLPADIVARRLRLLAAWVGFGCLCGPSAALIALPLGVRLWMERSRPAAVLFAVAAAALTLQAALTLAHGAARPMRVYPLDYTLEGALQTVMAPLLTPGLVMDIAGLAKGSGVSQVLAIGGSIAFAAAVFALVVHAGLGSPHRRAAILVAIAWAFVTAVQAYGQLEPLASISGWDDGRYFLFGSLCLLVLAAIGTTSAHRPAGSACAALLVVMLAAGASTPLRGKVLPLLREGPSWTQQLSRCERGKPCRVNVWPGTLGGPDWWMTVTR